MRKEALGLFMAIVGSLGFATPFVSGSGAMSLKQWFGCVCVIFFLTGFVWIVLLVERLFGSQKELMRTLDSTTQKHRAICAQFDDLQAELQNSRKIIGFTYQIFHVALADSEQAKTERAYYAFAAMVKANTNEGEQNVRDV
jgi:hypothetical protein